MSALAEIEQRLLSLSPKDKAAVVADAIQETGHLAFIPNEGPQTDAYFSKADITLFGGNPGGGKTALEIGLGLNEHHRTLFIRKSFADLGGALDTCEKLVGSGENLTRGSRPRYSKPDGGVIHFAGLSADGGIGGHQGVDHDLICIDEAAQIAERQIRLLMGWLRTDRPGQRCRVIMGSNPPLDPTGDWMIDFFGPWLNPTHPNPAKAGELRWFLPPEKEGGKDRECEQGDSMMLNGVKVFALSRTFIPSHFTDNPYYDPEEYARTLAALPEDVRQILMTGNFMLARKDQVRQVNPTDWVRKAQARWKETPPQGVPMCAMGIDCSGGGHDPMIIAPRYDGYFPHPVKVEGSAIPMEQQGRASAGFVVQHRTHDATVIVDMGGGYGGPLYEHLCSNIGKEYVVAYKGAEKSIARTSDNKLRFTNTRSQAYWQFREALDPGQEGGSPIALPPDPELVADLTAPTFTITPNGIKVEPKEDVCERLKRSTDKGDAVVMSWFSGEKMVFPGLTYTPEQGGPRGKRGLQVNLGPRRAATRR